MNISHVQMGPSEQSETISRLNKQKPFIGKSFYPQTAKCNFVETFHELVLRDLEQITTKTVKRSTKKIKSTPPPHPSHLNKKEREAINSLKDNREIVIRLAVKGGCIVLQNYEDYNVAHSI